MKEYLLRKRLLTLKCSLYVVRVNAEGKMLIQAYYLQLSLNALQVKVNGAGTFFQEGLRGSRG